MQPTKINRFLLPRQKDNADKHSTDIQPIRFIDLFIYKKN